MGEIDVFFLSYVLIPLKKELKHNEIKTGLEALKKHCSGGSAGLILQDKFRESLARTVGYNLDATTRKGTFQQKVYDPENSNDIQTYEYYRTVIA